MNAELGRRVPGGESQFLGLHKAQAVSCNSVGGGGDIGKAILPNTTIIIASIRYILNINIIIVLIYYYDKYYYYYYNNNYYY